MVHFPNCGNLVGADWIENLRWANTVSVLGREEGYTVKYTPSPEGVPVDEGRGNS